MRKHFQDVRPELILREMLLQHDNARPHTSVKTRAAITRLGRTVLPHPPYSPALASSDFHLFGLLSWEGSFSRMMTWATPSELGCINRTRKGTVRTFMPSFDAGAKLENCMESRCSIFFGATSPIGPGLTHSLGFLITHNDAPQSVGLLCTVE